MDQSLTFRKRVYRCTGGDYWERRKIYINVKLEFPSAMNSTLFSDADYPRKHADNTLKPYLSKKAFYFAAFYISG